MSFIMCLSEIEVGFLDYSVNTPVILLAVARYFFSGTRPTMHENVYFSPSVTKEIVGCLSI